MSVQDRGSGARTATTESELSRWLARPGLVDDLHRLASAEPEIIAVLMAACARHPAPITASSPLPEATPFTVVFLEQVSEAIQQGIPDDEPPAPFVLPAPPVGTDAASWQPTGTTWEPQGMEPATPEPAPDPSTRRFHGRAFDPDEVTLDHDAGIDHRVDDHGQDPALRPQRVLHPDEILEDPPTADGEAPPAIGG